ncbi:MAG: T9SS type A sorting domain-containing protein [Sphingobacteriales bacterium]|nr:MAG: T9SS type A sorting domain-containing protein [Sphingobacteriales bacterium]
MKRLHLILLLLCYFGGWTQDEGTTEAKVASWLKEKRLTFYGERTKDPVMKRYLALYDQLEADGLICRPGKNDGRLAITARRTGEQTVQVQWEVTNAVNVEGYVLERSFSKDGPYEKLTYQPAGNQGSFEFFQFLDNNSSEVQSFYRVIQVWPLGRGKTVKAVVDGYEQPLRLEVYPNPTTTIFTLSLQSRSAAPVQLRVIDVLGRIVEQKQNLPANGSLQIGSHYGSGIYFIELLQGKKRKQLTVIKTVSAAGL